MKKTRIRFTSEDDKLLAEYVAQCVRAGEGANGNKIYQDLEEHVRDLFSIRTRVVLIVAAPPSLLAFVARPLGTAPLAKVA